MAQPTTARRQIRLAAMQALAVLTSSNAIRLLDSPGIWPSQIETMPAVLLRVIRVSKDTMSKATSNFTSIVTLEIETRLSSGTPAGIQDAIELLDAQVEQALLTNVPFVSLMQQISIEAETEITAEAGRYLGGTRMQVRCEVAETFDPIDDAPDVLQPVAQLLESVDLHADLVGTFDPTGIYGDGVLFSNAVQPTPRISGPDGRDEGYLEINLPTS